MAPRHSSGWAIVPSGCHKALFDIYVVEVLRCHIWPRRAETQGTHSKWIISLKWGSRQRVRWRLIPSLMKRLDATSSTHPADRSHAARGGVVAFPYCLGKVWVARQKGNYIATSQFFFFFFVQVDTGAAATDLDKQLR